MQLCVSSPKDENNTTTHSKLQNLQILMLSSTRISKVNAARSPTETPKGQEGKGERGSSALPSRSLKVEEEYFFEEEEAAASGSVQIPKSIKSGVPPFSLKEARRRPSMLASMFDFSAMDPADLRGFKSFLFPADREFPIAMGLVVAQAVSGAGALSSVISVNLFNTASEYSSAAALFDEVFLRKVAFTWMPYNPTLGPLPYVVGTATPTISSVGCTVISLYHGATGYSGFGPSLANSTATIHHTAHTFQHVWRNNEKKMKGGPDLGKTGVVTPLQGWCPSDTTATGGYTGQVQILGSKNLTSQFFSLEIGVWALQFDLIFRNRA